MQHVSSATAHANACYSTVSCRDLFYAVGFLVSDTSGGCLSTEICYTHKGQSSSRCPYALLLAIANIAQRLQHNVPVAVMSIDCIAAAHVQAPAHLPVDHNEPKLLHGLASFADSLLVLC